METQKKENARSATKSLRSIGKVQPIMPRYKFVNNRITKELFISIGKLSVLLIIFSITQKSYAQDEIGEADKIFNWANALTPGFACIVTQNGNVVLDRNYRSADLERGIPISRETAFDIGSTIKQFIAAIILLLVQEKRLSLSVDIRKYLPDLHKYSHTITIDHLLTHTSGIRDWAAILPLASGDPSALTLILRQRAPNFPTGEEWSYSNTLEYSNPLVRKVEFSRGSKPKAN